MRMTDTKLKMLNQKKKRKAWIKNFEGPDQIKEDKD